MHSIAASIFDHEKDKFLFTYVAYKVQLTLFSCFYFHTYPFLLCCKCCMGPIRALAPMGTVHSNNNVDILVYILYKLYS